MLWFSSHTYICIIKKNSPLKASAPPTWKPPQRRVWSLCNAMLPHTQRSQDVGSVAGVWKCGQFPSEAAAESWSREGHCRPESPVTPSSRLWWTWVIVFLLAIIIKAANAYGVLRVGRETGLIWTDLILMMVLSRLYLWLLFFQGPYQTFCPLWVVSALIGNHVLRMQIARPNPQTLLIIKSTVGLMELTCTFLKRPTATPMPLQLDGTWESPEKLSTHTNTWAPRSIKSGSLGVSPGPGPGQY